MSEQPNNGELLLPVCISDDGMLDLISALDLYKILGYEGQLYPAFESVLNAIPYRGNVVESPCFDGESGTGGACYRMDTTTEIFEFYPNDPFDSTDKSQTIIGGSWITLEKILGLDIAPEWVQNLVDKFGDIAGYFPNDCFVTYLDDDFPRIPDIKEEFFQFLDNLSNVVPFPTVTIKINGSGQADLEFPIVPLGGRVIITKDFEPNLNDLADIINGDFENVSLFVTVAEIERDLLSSTPEFIPSTVVELEFPDDGDHTIRCIFVPSIEIDQAPFIFPFGGIREIEVCGNIQVIGSQTGTIYTPLNYRNLEAHRNGVIGMTTYDDLRRAVHHGTIDAWKYGVIGTGDGITPNIAQGLEINKAGELTLKLQSGSSGVKPDVNAVADEIIYGGAMGVGRGFRDLVGEIILRRGVQGRLPENVASILRGTFFLAPIPDGIDLLAQLLGDAYDDATDMVSPTVVPSAVANIVYCNGANKQSLSRYALEVEDVAGTDAVDIANWYRLLIGEITQEQIDLWYQDGLAIPDGGFTASDCYLFPPQEFVLSDASAVSGAWIYPYETANKPSGRLTRFEISGKITDSRGYEWDGFYIKTDADVITRRIGEPVYFNGSNSWTINPPVIPYKPSGGYAFTATTPSNRNNTAWSGWRPSNVTEIIQMGSYSPVGTITVRVVDLGNG